MAGVGWDGNAYQLAIIIWIVWEGKIIVFLSVFLLMKIEIINLT